MDSGDGQVFLFLNDKGEGTPFGGVYVANEFGRYFSLSLDNVIQGEQVDFERIDSLKGTYIANKYSPQGP